MPSLKMTLKIFVAVVMVAGLGLGVVSGPTPFSLNPLGSHDGNANWELKEQLAPVHTEPGEPGEDDDPAELDEGPTAEEIAMKDTENLARVQAHQFAPDLRTSPVQAPAQGGDKDPDVDLLFEGFEVSVPPTDWTLIQTNVAQTWYQESYAPYEGMYYASCQYDDTYSGPQDEWLISPVVDLSAGGWYLDFWWNGSYYWSVDPYPNCTLTVLITTDGGSTWDYLWSQYDAGVFSNWVWYETQIDLSAYSSATAAQFAIVYTGYDGAQFNVDAFSINDAAPPLGRCCYGTDFLDCDDLSEADCDALGGHWSLGLNCLDNPCPTVPPNDEPEDAITITDGETVTGSTITAQIDCPGVLDWNAVWYRFDAPYAENDVSVDYCGTPGDINTVGIVVYDEVLPLDCSAYIIAGDYAFVDCGDGNTNPNMQWFRLPGPATYLFPVYVDDGLKGGMDFSFDFSLTESAPLPPGGSCSDPYPLSLSTGDLPLTVGGLTTCGLGNIYANSCLGYYDGGEDFTMELVLTEDMDLNIALNTISGETWTGIMIADACGDVDPCIATSTSSSSNEAMNNLSLTAGTYYIMVDTWPSPDCIADFELIFETPPPPQPGDNCDDPMVVSIPAELPYSNDNYTCGRGDYYNNTCLGTYDGDEDLIYQLNITDPIDLNFRMDPLGQSGTNGMMIMENCPPLDASDCITYNTIYGGVNIISAVHFEPGTYYVMIDHYPGVCIPALNFQIEEYGGPTPGDNCASPVSVKLPDDMTGGGGGDTYVDINYTCGRIDDYDATCLGSYDGGEDIIYELDVAGDMSVDIHLTTTTTWTGIMVADACGNVSPCIAYATGSAGNKDLYGVDLTTGFYYLMVDTWPSPDCIPDFTLEIAPAAPPQPGDDYDNCVALTGEVVDEPFNTVGMTFDGPGGCMTSPNIWYCWTASCDGIATFSLCGSSYDTKLAVYGGTDPFTDPMLACNDDACGLQSEVQVGVVAGNVYLVEVGGYSSNAGAGILNITCEYCPPPPNDNCEDVTPVVLTSGVMETFTGDNHCATNQCASFPGPHVWEAFTINTTSDVYLDYCGTSPAFGNAWLNLAIGCPCASFTAAGAYDLSTCGDGNVTIFWDDLPAGTYYYPVMKDAGYNADGPYTINVVAYGLSTLSADPTFVDFGLQAAGSTGSETVNLTVVGSTPINYVISYVYNIKGKSYGDYTELSSVGPDRVMVDYVSPGTKQGGDDVSTATVISAVPAYETGTTVGYNNDYDEVCPYSGSTSPDVVYEYTPSADIMVTIDLCASGYDPKVYVYENTVTSGSPFACNDDACPGYRSLIEELQLYGGNTYYIVIDGYGGDAGSYVLDMYEYIPPPDFECPAGAGIEPEDCGDDTNGGCNMTVPAFTFVECGDTTCGYSWASGGTRDTDWYQLTLYATTTVTLRGQANFNSFILGFVDTSDCNLASALSPYVTGNADQIIEVSRDAGPGTYWIFVGMTVYDGVPCGTTNDYWFEVDCPEGPVLWLSAAPESGTLPGDATTPLSVNYDATDLEEGLYSAEVVINHDGGKGTTVIPVDLEIGEVEPPLVVATPPSFDFGTVIEGETGSDLLTISNGGGGMFNFVLDVDYGMKDLTGSYVQSPDVFAPGETMDIDLDVWCNSPDFEYIWYVEVTAPTGVTINGATTIAQAGTPGISYQGATGQTMVWGTFTYSDYIDYGLGTGSMDLTFDAGLTGDLTFDWYVEGDIWGAPPHDVSGSFLLPLYIDPLTHWLTVAPQDGMCPPDAPITVSFDATDLPGGVYNADIVIIDDIPDKGETRVPVTLAVYEWDHVALNPDPVLAIEQNAVDPKFGTAYVGELYDLGAYTLADVASATVNGLPCTIIPATSHPLVQGVAYGFEFDLRVFCADLGWPLGIEETPYDLVLTFGDASTFTITDVFDYYGHVSGDFDMNGNVDIADLVNMVNYMFGGGPAPEVMAVLDCNGDCVGPDISDLLTLVNFMFNNGPELGYCTQ